MTKPVCAIAGAGPGNGAAFARKFDRAGYRVALISRSRDFCAALAAELNDAGAYQCDLTDEGQAADTFRAIAASMGPPQVLIYNVKGIRVTNVEDTTMADLETQWRIHTAGCMTAVQQVTPAMKKTKRGAIVIIGATASVKGSANFAPFAAAKAGQRMLAQSMARHLWPQGIHVSYVVVDGMIDEPASRKLAPDRSDDFFMQPDDIAESVYFLAHQPRSAWTFEMDLRPSGESW